jgi:predicted metal-binding protein
MMTEKFEGGKFSTLKRRLNLSKSAFESAKKIRIGLKYCGGCKPQYDRVQAVALIRQRLPEKIELVSHEEPDTHGTLVVTGCETACVDMTPFAGRPLWVATSLREIEQLIEKMKEADPNG